MRGCGDVGAVDVVDGCRGGEAGRAASSVEFCAEFGERGVELSDIVVGGFVVGVSVDG